MTVLKLDRIMPFRIQRSFMIERFGVRMPFAVDLMPLNEPPNNRLALKFFDFIIFPVDRDNHPPTALHRQNDGIEVFN